MEAVQKPEEGKTHAIKMEAAQKLEESKTHAIKMEMAAKAVQREKDHNNWEALSERQDKGVLQPLQH